MLRNKKYIGQIIQYDPKTCVGVLAMSTKQLFTFTRFTDAFDPAQFETPAEFMVFIPDLDRAHNIPGMLHVKTIIKVLR